MKLMAIRILVMDDSTIFREDLRLLIESRVNWEVCGLAVDALEGVQQTENLK